jgi:transketolase
MNPEVHLRDLESVARRVRRNCVRMGIAAGSAGAHFGSSLSLVHIMTALVCSVANIGPHLAQNPFRDRIVLSKGHGAIAYYAALAELGFFSDEELLTYKSNETELHAHPSRNPSRGIEASTGSLGLGLSLAAGMSLALQKRDIAGPRVFVVVGDGECNEGSVWEAAMFIAHRRLVNICVIVDNNQMQYDGRTSEVLDMGSLVEKWTSFGWYALNVNGHDTDEVVNALGKTRETDAPVAIVADTVKGWSIDFMEGNPSWHFGRLNAEQERRAFEFPFDAKHPRYSN